MNGACSSVFAFSLIVLCFSCFYLLLNDEEIAAIDVWTRHGDDQEMFDYARNLKTPFLVLDKTLQDRSRDNIDLNYIKEGLESSDFTMDHCKNGTEEVFTLLHPERPPSILPVDQTYQLTTISAKQFFDSHTSSFLYYTSPVEKLPAQLSSELAKTFRSFSFDGIDLVRIKEEQSTYRSQSTLWLGTRGVTANCHFDRSHNFFVQLSGQKRWILYPPTDWNSFYLYPSFHPSYHQSQVGKLQSVDIDSFPLFIRHSIPIEIILNPGDIMYIPR